MTVPPAALAENENASLFNYAIPENLQVSERPDITITVPYPTDALSIDESSFSFTGNNNVTITKVDNDENNKKVIVTLHSSTTERIDIGTVYGFLNEYKERFQTAPGNDIWRYVGGRAWQKNTWLRSCFCQPPPIKYNATDSSNPSAYPPDMSVGTYAHPDLPSPRGAIWFDGSDVKAGKTGIDNTRDSTSNLFIDPSSIILSQRRGDIYADSFGQSELDYDKEYLFSGRNIPGIQDSDKTRTQFVDITNDASRPPGIGFGPDVEGRRYYVNLYYAVEAQAQIIQYVFTGGISFKYTPSPDWTLTASAIAEPRSTVFDPSNPNTTVAVTTIGTLSKSVDPGAIDHWIIYQRKEPDHDPSEDYKSPEIKGDGTLTGQDSHNFTIPASDVGNADYTQNFKTRVYVFFKGNCVGQNCKFDGSQYYLDAPADTSVEITQQPVPPPPPPDPPIPLQKPTACIRNNPTVRAGDYLQISGSCSYSPNGAITKFDWSTPGSANKLTNQMSGQVVYFNEGTNSIGLTITDEKGMSASASSSVKVTPPYPIACIDIKSGTLKQNRKITIDGSCSSSPEMFPINSYSWSITPVSGGTVSDIKPGTAFYSTENDILFKNPGVYKLTLTVTNTKNLSDTTTRQVTITPDYKPIADFDVVGSILRDPNNGNQATIEIWDRSYSIDGDPITQRDWYIIYDTNNNGSFSDETPILINSGNSTHITYVTNQVGKYRIMLSVTESFGQPTIPQFITASDYRSSNTWE
ncbi:hypothetical protein ABES02_29310 [Neobacillus pocheonensis]|uniref:hypothetical protein n=1 Tax=Neobacillus pocheonensis TaxID=363869 RepID=UPI003D2A0F49